MTEAALREEMVLLGRSLFERGLTAGSSGNLSTRLPDGGFLMTPTNASLGFLDPARLAKLDDNGDWLAGDKPTKEDFLHLAMYRGRPKLKAVSHLHSTYSVCVSCMCEGADDDLIPPLTPYCHMRVGPVARAPYFAPGDKTLGPIIQELALKHSGIIISNHGPVVGGKSLRDAVFAIEELEESAKLQFLLKDRLTRPLTQEQLEELDAIRLR